MPDGIRDAFSYFGMWCATSYLVLFVLVAAVELKRRMK
jgi:hypothetical protein